MRPITKFGKIIRLHLMEYGQTIGDFSRKIGRAQLTVGRALQQPLKPLTGTVLRILAALPADVRHSAQDALQEELQKELRKEIK